MWVGTSHEFLEDIAPWLSLAGLFLQKLEKAFITQLSCCMITCTCLVGRYYIQEDILLYLQVPLVGLIIICTAGECWIDVHLFTL